MDQRQIALKNDIAETRNAMGQKIDLIAHRVHDTVIGPKLAADQLIDHLHQAKKAMQSTASATADGADYSHPAVAATTERVQAFFHLLEATQRRPWYMLSSALFLGYILGSLNRGKVFAIRYVHPELQSPRLQPPTPAGSLSEAASGVSCSQ